LGIWKFALGTMAANVLFKEAVNERKLRKTSRGCFQAPEIGLRMGGGRHVLIRGVTPERERKRGQ